MGVCVLCLCVCGGEGGHGIQRSNCRIVNWKYVTVGVGRL